MDLLTLLLSLSVCGHGEMRLQAWAVAFSPIHDSNMVSPLQIFCTTPTKQAHRALFPVGSQGPLRDMLGGAVHRAQKALALSWRSLTTHR